MAISGSFKGVGKVDEKVVKTISGMAKSAWKGAVAEATSSAGPKFKERPAAGESQFLCWLCGSCFENKQQLGSHTAARHGIGHEARYAAQGSQCVVCLMEFHHRAKLIDHLRSCRCLGLLRGNIIPYTAAEEREAYREWAPSNGRTGVGRSSMGYMLTDIPATQAEGPQCHWAVVEHPVCVAGGGGGLHVGDPQLAE